MPMPAPAPAPAACCQVRKVIWDLFALCPTPAAAIAADVQQVQVRHPGGQLLSCPVLRRQPVA